MFGVMVSLYSTSCHNTIAYYYLDRKDDLSWLFPIEKLIARHVCIVGTIAIY